jgi:glycosyltransferase involved in cell wall biosynthesis
VVQGLAIGQHAWGHRVVVAAVVQEALRDHPFLLPLARAGIEVREILVPHRGYLQERAAVAALCKELRPDVVHSHGYRTDVIDCSVVRGLGIATVATNHGPTRGTLRHQLYQYLHWRFLRHFDAVIAVSRSIASNLIAFGLSSSRVHVVPNAWSEIAQPLSRQDARVALDLPPDVRVLGWVGRMSREKGVDVLVDAMIRLSDRSIVACMIGDGLERAGEEARARQAVGSRMIWKGMIAEAGRLCTAFDLFVLSSRTEGVPIALLEAAAAGTPIVATKVGSVPEVVTEGEAWLIEPEAPQALADAIERALQDPARSASQAARAQKRLATEFGHDAWLERHDEIYAAAQEVRRNSREGNV